MEPTDVQCPHCSENLFYDADSDYKQGEQCEYCELYCCDCSLYCKACGKFALRRFISKLQGSSSTKNQRIMTIEEALRQFDEGSSSVTILTCKVKQCFAPRQGKSKLNKQAILTTLDGSQEVKLAMWGEECCNCDGSMFLNNAKGMVVTLHFDGKGAIVQEYKGNKSINANEAFTAKEGAIATTQGATKATQRASSTASDSAQQSVHQIATGDELISLLVRIRKACTQPAKEIVAEQCQGNGGTGVDNAQRLQAEQSEAKSLFIYAMANGALNLFNRKSWQEYTDSEGVRLDERTPLEIAIHYGKYLSLSDEQKKLPICQALVEAKDALCKENWKELLGNYACEEAGFSLDDFNSDFSALDEVFKGVKGFSDMSESQMKHFTDNAELFAEAIQNGVESEDEIPF